MSRFPRWIGALLAAFLPAIAYSADYWESPTARPTSQFYAGDIPIAPFSQILLTADELPAVPDVSKKLLIEKGSAAFDNSCIDCHPAKTSLDKKKTFSAWQETVLRMSKKKDANVPENTHLAIATFLTAKAGLKSGDAQAESKPNNKKEDAADSKDKDAKKPRYDPALVKSGETSFNASCITCHDAEKSFQVKKSLDGWRSNVQRMAAKAGANIPSSTHEAIATFLTSHGDPDAQGTAGGNSSASTASSSAADLASQTTFTGTISPSYRTDGHNDLEYPGFFGDVWVGAAYQGKGPVSARATACFTCHEASGTQLGRFELLDAAIRFNVTKWVLSKQSSGSTSSDPHCELSVEAGRFVAPFGAYYQQVNPGVDRMVTKPLIYNMGERVQPTNIGDPVLPMPYSDNGVNLELSMPFDETTTATVNGYAVNGLQGNSTGIGFFQSRSYLDNNSSPAVGGRFSIGGKNLRLGVSCMGGRFNPNTGVVFPPEALNYTIFGADAVFHWEDYLRVQCEYAERTSDRYGNVPSIMLFQERVSGAYVEAEALLSRKYRLNFITRYDIQSRQSLLPPPGSSLTTGDFAVQRFTYGVNWTLPGGSLLMVNNEHWFMPGDLRNEDVVGVRWSIMF